MNKDRAIYILRWIGLLPAAILGGLIGYWLIVNGIYHMCVNYYAEPYLLDTFATKILLHGFSNFLMGAAFIYTSFRVAPSCKKQVIIIMTGLALILSGACLFAAIISGNYWAIYGTVFIIFGSISGAMALYKDTEKIIEQ